jgi:hypothetical protein
MLQAFGVPGSLGVLLLVAWMVGWLLLGMHAGAFHLLVPTAIVLLIAQGIRRINADHW